MKDPTFNEVAQVAHFFTGLSVVLTFAYLSGHIVPILICCLISAAVKEFFYDYKYETPAARGSSLLDFAVYIAGMAVGAGIWLIGKH